VFALLRAPIPAAVPAKAAKQAPASLRAPVVKAGARATSSFSGAAPVRATTSAPVIGTRVEFAGVVVSRTDDRMLLRGASVNVLLAGGPLPQLERGKDHSGEGLLTSVEGRLWTVAPR
jgi:hypothetical protein